MRGSQVQRIAGSYVSVDADLKFAIVTLEGRRAGAAPDGGDIFQTHLPKFR